MRRFTTRTLERVGYIVHAAEHGRAALALLDATSARIDVVVTDLVMPEMNGVQLAEALATIYPRLPVLIMSGYSMDVLESQGLSQLSGPTIAKPFTADELVSAIKAACAAATTDAGRR